MKFYAEIMEDDSKGRVVEIDAENPEAALARASGFLSEYEYVYQICTDVEGAELPQPVYDYMNGFKIYK
jgi:hypothetical protein